MNRNSFRREYFHMFMAIAPGTAVARPGVAASPSGLRFIAAAALALVGCDPEDEADAEALVEQIEPEEGVHGLAAVAEDTATQHEWGPDGLVQPAPEPLAKFLSPVSGYQYFTWKKGMPDVAMGAVADKVCLLAGVQGVFAGSLDIAEAAAVNGQYRLRGGGGVTEVMAICLSTTFVMHTATYSTTTTADVSATADRGCFLAAVRGRFNGNVSGVGFTGADVTKLATGKWRVRVAGTGGSAHVRCIMGANAVPLKYSSEAAWLTGQVATQLESPVSQPCLLTRLSGNFSSPADWAGLWLQEGLTGVLQQMLGGYGLTAKTSAATRCVAV